ncbi:MAG: type 4a pilus biogenesis protein PilO [Ectothiorhodospiraceae bacterium]|nr:type 4a pilus biogenesis protein PilO [Ectothiorhodospiraceae bacterium]
MKLQGMDLNDLDLNNIGSWPPLIKGIVAALVFGLVVFLGWYLNWSDMLRQLEREQAQEPQLRSEFELKQRRAANLEAYEQMLAEMEEELEDRLRQLPSRVEIPRLLADISQAGLGAGLDFELFRPGSPVRRDFYAERPIEIAVRGNYHQFGEFISEVANLPRIVTLHNIEITRESGEQLAMRAVARTYWYLDDEEAAQ